MAARSPGEEQGMRVDVDALLEVLDKPLDQECRKVDRPLLVILRCLERQLAAGIGQRLPHDEPSTEHID